MIQDSLCYFLGFVALKSCAFYFLYSYIDRDAQRHNETTLIKLASNEDRSGSRDDVMSLFFGDDDPVYLQ